MAAGDVDGSVLIFCIIESKICLIEGLFLLKSLDF